MNREDCKWILNWDHKGWKKASSAASPYTQQDWNYTLITRINQCSAQIHQANLRSGADTIFLNREIFNIIENYEFYDDKTKKLSRYNVVIDNSLGDVIYVTNKKLLNFNYKVGGTPLKIDSELDDEYRKLIIDKETFETEEQIIEHKKRLLACIPIEGYNYIEDYYIRPA